MYVHVYQITKNRGPGPCNSLRHADNRKYFSGLSLTRNRGKMCTCFTWRGKWEKFGDVLAEGKVTLLWLMNSNMVKPEKFDHLHLVYHFTVPLSILSISKYKWNLVLPFKYLQKLIMFTLFARKVEKSSWESFKSIKNTMLNTVNQ